MLATCLCDRGQIVCGELTIERVRESIELKGYETWKLQIRTPPPTGMNQRPVAWLRVEGPRLRQGVRAALANGYNSWSASPFLGRDDTLLAETKDLQRFFGDDRLFLYAEQPGHFHAWSWSILDEGNGRSAFLGAIDEDRFFNLFEFNLRLETCHIWLNIDGFDFSRMTSEFRQGPVTIAHLIVPLENEEERDSLDRVTKAWMTLVRQGERIPRLRNQHESTDTQPPLLGYTSWYNRYTNIDEKYLLEMLSHVKALTTAQVFQVDDGYQKCVGDWLIPSRGFASGVSVIAARARNLGLTPGIWCAPFVTMEFAASTEAHPDWLLRDEGGDVVVCGDFRHWGGKFLAWDTENLDYRAWMEAVLKTMLVDWGFGFLKADFLYAAAMLPKGSRPRAERGARAHQWLHEVVRQNGAQLLSCGAVLANSYGRCDYARIGPDVALSWELAEERHHTSREKCSTRSAIINTATRSVLNGVAFGNDPDVVILREDNQALSLEQRAALAATNAAFGGLIFSSDDPALYEEDSRKLLHAIEATAASLRPRGFHYESRDALGIETNCGIFAIDLDEKSPKARLIQA